MNKRRLRAVLCNLHQWLGLSLGLLFALLGITGSLLTFYPELELVFHPEIRAGIIREIL